MDCHALLQEIFPTPGIEPKSLTSPALAGGFFTTSPGKPLCPLQYVFHLRSFFFFFSFKKIIYLFTFDYAGSSLLQVGFLSLSHSEWGLLFVTVHWL